MTGSNGFHPCGGEPLPVENVELMLTLDGCRTHTSTFPKYRSGAFFVQGKIFSPPDRRKRRELKQQSQLEDGGEKIPKSRVNSFQFIRFIAFECH